MMSYDNQMSHIEYSACPSLTLLTARSHLVLMTAHISECQCGVQTPKQCYQIWKLLVLRSDLFSTLAYSGARD